MFCHESLKQTFISQSVSECTKGIAYCPIRDEKNIVFLRYCNSCQSPFTLAVVRWCTESTKHTDMQQLFQYIMLSEKLTVAHWWHQAAPVKTNLVDFPVTVSVMVRKKLGGLMSSFRTLISIARGKPLSSISSSNWNILQAHALTWNRVKYIYPVCHTQIH